ncbi:MAG TPA: tetratricopeptide repeat protein [Bryobacteraceae bacterium]
MRLGGIHGFTLHTKRGYPKERLETSLICDTMLGIGLAFDRLGHTLQAAAIIAPFIACGRLPSAPRAAVRLALCLARANQMRRALEIAEQLFKSDSTFHSAQAFLIPVLAQAPRLSFSERDFLVRVMDRIAREFEGRGDTFQASSLHYTLANLLRSMSRWREAIHHYRIAARLNSGYIGRAYFWRDFGSVLFLGRRFALAAKFYAHSLELEESKSTAFAYADALMFSGQYRAAEATFGRHIERPITPDDAECELKRSSLSWLRELIELDEQRRTTPVFPEGFEPRSLEESEIRRICLEALRSDALSALAWFNLGGVYHRTCEAQNATKCFLLAAVIAPWDVQAWSNAFGSAIESRDGVLAALTIWAAYRKNGEGFLRHLAERMPQELAESLLAIVEEGVDKARNQEEGVTVRAHYPDGRWEETIWGAEGPLGEASSQ